MRSLDLHGLDRAESTRRVRAFLDRARRDGELSVLIIHGLGTGALKDAVRTLLDQHPGVADHGTARPKDGGAGATHVRLHPASRG